MSTPIKYIFHLYNRAGFGIPYKDALILSRKKLKDVVNGLFNNATNDYLSAIKPDYAACLREMQETGVSKKEINELIRDKGSELNLAWFKQLLTSNYVLREKQTLFWHNHFACRINNSFLLQQLNNIHRKFAFANFHDLLIDVSKSAAMLDFLNNQQNRKQHPNENFARELMELFTLGRGNYTEDDIRESARAFTGWAYNRETFEFEFKEKQHDYGQKTFFGQTGNFGGEDIINMIMNKKETAYFLCKKMYKYYVNESINEEHVNTLAEFYFANHYNTEALLKKIFMADWFYEDINIGANIKSPLEFLVGLSRQYNVKYGNEKLLLILQRQLGQILFYPPNVAGWPGGTNWIDSTTLLLRMRLPSLILNNGDIETNDRIDDPDSMMLNAQPSEQINEKFNTAINWTDILNSHRGLDLKTLCNVTLAKNPDRKIIDMIDSQATNDTKEQIIKLLSLPEYNLC